MQDGATIMYVRRAAKSIWLRICKFTSVSDQFHQNSISVKILRVYKGAWRRRPITELLQDVLRVRGTASTHIFASAGCRSASSGGQSFASFSDSPKLSSRSAHMTSARWNGVAAVYPRPTICDVVKCAAGTWTIDTGWPSGGLRRMAGDSAVHNSHFKPVWRDSTERLQSGTTAAKVCKKRRYMLPEPRGKLLSYNVTQKLHD